jgi:hypothetical protein|tara:strand:- start:2223 stop:2405 length:183 start_codon:yes stop_codon:yes gene_type:complete
MKMNKEKIDATVEFYTRYLQFVKTVNDDVHHAAVMYAGRLKTDESNDNNVNTQDVGNNKM